MIKIRHIRASSIRFAYRPISSALVIGLASFAWFEGAEAQEKPAQTNAAAEQKLRAPVVTVAEAKRLNFVDNVLVTGSLVPREEVLAGAEIDGYRITAVLAEEGDRVEAGQVLARLAREALETQSLQNQASFARAKAAIDQARNQIVENEATLRQAEDAFNRIKPLRDSGTASQATFDERDAAFRTARARLAAIREGVRLAEADLLLNQAQKRELEVKLGHTEIKAPAAGLISRRTARVGAVSSVGADALFRIIRDGEVELDAEVPEFYMTKLRASQRAQVEIMGTSERKGTVRLVSTEVSTTSRLGHVRIFMGTSSDLRIGSFGKALIDAGRRSSVGVPSTAVLYQNESATVLLVKDNRVVERQVKTGIQTGDNVEIREGLKAGDVVVMRAGSLLRGGDLIEPQFIEMKTASEIRNVEVAQ